MTGTPTPFERLIQLEKRIGDLEAELHTDTPTIEKPTLSPRHLWPADELLLTRLIRRNPEALKAYEAPAELTQTESQGILLKATEGSSPFRLCELLSGDAVVWLEQAHESWLYGTDIFRSVFKTPELLDQEGILVLQALPRFVFKVQGREWTLERPGEMIPASRPFNAQSDQAELEQRVQKLEQTLARMRGKLDSELSSLRSHVQILQDQVNRLTRLGTVMAPHQTQAEIPNEGTDE
jgi:BMFP domain-containing protein YqiC